MTDRDQARIFQPIESDEFAVRLNVASTSNVFRDILFKDSSYQDLIQWLEETTSRDKRIEHTLNRILDLARFQIDLRYENPYDAALAAYLLALATISPSYAKFGAEIIIGAQQTWWAKHVARSVLQGSSTVSNMSGEHDHAASVGTTAADVLLIDVRAHGVLQRETYSTLTQRLNRFSISEGGELYFVSTAGFRSYLVPEPDLFSQDGIIKTGAVNMQHSAAWSH